MTTLIEHLKQTRILCLLIITAVPLILLSKWSVSHWELVLLDGIRDPDVARALLKQLTPEQHHGHLWYTTTLDVILPFAAAGLFASSVLQSFGRYALCLAALPLAAIPVDLAEGIIQVLVLTGTADLLAVKAYTTPVKELFYNIGFLLSLVALAKWLFMKVKAATAA